MSGSFTLDRVVCGEALDLLRSIPDGSIDAVVTDPPYSSGGFTRGDRMTVPSSKYIQTDSARVFVEFSGDNRDARSWTYWMALWLGEARRATRSAGYIMVFTDWRMLPCLSDAIQAGGWVWRGIVAWDKGEGARAPHTGYFRHQAEFVVWGTNGPCETALGRGPVPGVIRRTVRADDKHHMTGKPVALMQRLLSILEPESRVLDPFAGSGSTGVACVSAGLRFYGCELVPEYVEIANRRIETEEAGIRLVSREVVVPVSLFGGGLCAAGPRITGPGGDDNVDPIRQPHPD